MRTEALSRRREEEAGLSSEHDVSSYPTVMVVKGNYSYLYRGMRTLDSFKQFALGGYANETVLRRLVQAKSTWETIVAVLGHIIEGFIQLMDHMGLTFLPTPIKVALPLLLLFSPVIAIVLCILCMQDSDSPVPEPEPIPEPAAEAEAKSETGVAAKKSAAEGHADSKITKPTTEPQGTKPKQD